MIRPMMIEDYEPVLALWQQTEGVGLNESDTRAAIGAYLRRNPGMSFVATEASGAIVGAVLAGHDGRRGYLHHLAVARSHRGRGLGKALVEACVARLGAEGIRKCNLFLFADNTEGEAFWTRQGFRSRVDLKLLQKPLP